MEYYIKKNDVVSLLMKEAKSHGLSFSAEAYERAANIVACMPNEEVQPVKFGKWEEVAEYGGWGDTYYRCSVCGEEWYIDTGTPIENGMKYCPSCGARMDGDAE